MEEIAWYVFGEDFNTRTIIKYNIFDHWSFRKSLCELREALKKDPTLDTAKQLKSELMYYFWSKVEHEILIGPLIWSTISDFEKQAKKIDVYEQVMLNFDVFHKYVLSILPYLKEE